MENGLFYLYRVYEYFHWNEEINVNENGTNQSTERMKFFNEI